MSIEKPKEESAPAIERHAAFFDYLKLRFPEGRLGAENAIPITIDGNQLELTVFEPGDDRVLFGLFLPGHEYARKTLEIHRDGRITEDESGVIPDFDAAVEEPRFRSSNEQIVEVVALAVNKLFSEENVLKKYGRELSEEEQQASQEQACRERFIQDWVLSSPLTSEQKVFVANYINTKSGAWREYNGTDFKVVESRMEGNVWKVSFGMFFDDYEAQRVDVEIPLSE